ncbi:MAG: RsmD family RNA methyltransferase [Candidatus Nomurabacteria bacterium]|jgi:23S rRNA (uracil1939-C5)-methyltransferase|nr:RsmD family RNA methyltransferase [Candidatus Nomurabacteria bacterium]
MELARIEKLVPGGQGIGTLHDGRKAFVWGVLPGELVEFEVTREKRTYCEGVVENIVEASPKRIAPKDQCYLSTSPWQVFDYAFELEQKTRLVEECFGQQHIEISSPLMKTDGQDFCYRNKMEYSLFWDNEIGQITLAFHARASHRKVPIAASSIERPEILANAINLVADLNSAREEARAYQALLARCNQSGEVSATLFEKGKPHPKMDLLQDILLGYNYSYSPNGFFQINLPLYEMVLREIKACVKTDSVLDLYAGVGTIGLSVARDKNLTLVEVDKSAYSELEKNARGTDAKTILAKSEDVLDHITSDTTVILDPPRAGCDISLITKLNELKTPMIIYLSCNPITQARDIAMLQENYKIEKIQPYNFFPRTPHIENLVVLVAK